MVLNSILKNAEVLYILHNVLYTTRSTPPMSSADIRFSSCCSAPYSY